MCIFNYKHPSTVKQNLEDMIVVIITYQISDIMSFAPSQCIKIQCGYCNSECLLKKSQEAFKRKASRS